MYMRECGTILFDNQERHLLYREVFSQSLEFEGLSASFTILPFRPSEPKKTTSSSVQDVQAAFLVRLEPLSAEVKGHILNAVVLGKYLTFLINII